MILLQLKEHKRRDILSMLTSSESPSSSFPMNGCGSGTVVVLGPDGITIMCTSMPITLSSCAAICFPSTHTPLLPFSFMFFPSMPTSLSHVIFMPLLLLAPVVPSQETATFLFPFSPTFLPDAVLSFLQFIFMSPSSFAIWIPFFLSRTQRIFPAALSMLIPSLPASSVISMRWFLVWYSMLSAFFSGLVFGGRCFSSYRQPSTMPWLLSPAGNATSTCVPMSGSVQKPCPPPVHLPLIWYHGLTHPGDSRSSCTLTLPRHSGSLLSATIPSVNGLSPWNAFWLWLYMPFPWVSSCVSLYVSSFFLIFWFTFFL